MLCDRRYANNINLRAEDKLIGMERFMPRSPLGMRLVEQRQLVWAIAARRHASNLRVFGSVVRGEDRPGSDVDLLVDLEDPTDLLNLLGLERELEEVLGVRVDADTTESLRPRVRAEVLAEASIL